MINQRKGQIRGRIMVSGILELISPLLLSRGKGEETDQDFVRDGTGDPCIPGTSWAGVVRNAFRELEAEDRALFRSFFGYVHPSKRKKANTEDQEFQSAWITYDLPIVKKNGQPMIRTEERENVRIDPVYRTAKDTALFNYEILVPGTQFEFGMEVIIREGFDRKKYEDLTRSILASFMDGAFSLGGKTRSGYGRVTLSNVKYRYFDFTDKQDILDWYSDRRTLNSIERPELVYRPKSDLVYFDGDFELRGSMIIREAVLDKSGGNESGPDQRHLMSYGRDVIPGTSLKGVIRHRALAILKLYCQDAEERIKQLFGWVENERQDKDKKHETLAIPGRVTVHETVIESGIRSPQTRIKVDHFTGGVMETALFQEEPVWSDGKARARVRLELEKDPERPWETGLLLQVLKDLWTGQLAVGGGSSVGRGRFTGRRLSIQDGNHTAQIEQTDEGLTFENDTWFREAESAWTTFIEEKNHA